jgi:hypothetical protein
VNDFNDRLFRELIGESYEDFVRGEDADTELELLEEEILSGYPVCLIGFDGKNKPFILTQQDLVSSIQVMGAPRQGKSKFLELLLVYDRYISAYRQDMDMRPMGSCLIDPTENGDTANAMLKWCCANNFRKVLYINPADFETYDKIPVIQPFIYPKSKPDRPITDWERDRLRQNTVSDTKHTLEVLWNTSFDDTPRLERYIPAVLTVLYNAGMTLAESKYFLDAAYIQQREQILSHTDVMDPSRRFIESAFRDRFALDQFQSTINRLNPYHDYILGLMVGSKLQAIPWGKLVAEGWLILTNLDPQKMWGKDPRPQRLLGTLIISKIISAIYRLSEKSQPAPYSLYIDEVGDYSTSELATILNKKPKLGIRLCVAHHSSKQIKNEEVLDAISGRARIKVMFHQQDYQERLNMQRSMGYGGELPEKNIHFTLGQLTKQRAAISINGKQPREIRLVNVDTPEVSPERLAEFKQQLYEEQPWFHARNVIKQEISERITITTVSYTNNRGHRSARVQTPPAGTSAGEDQVLAVDRTPPDGGTSGTTGKRTEKKKRIKTIFS